MLGSYISPGWIERDRPKETPMQTTPTSRDRPFFPSIPSPSACASAAWSRWATAAAIVVVGLGAFALLPPVRQSRPPATPILVAANDSDTRAPRMLENSAPFSFADLVERVSPAVVTITVGNHHHRG